jgi:hypothetical protein
MFALRTLDKLQIEGTGLAQARPKEQAVLCLPVAQTRTLSIGSPWLPALLFAMDFLLPLHMSSFVH